MKYYLRTFHITGNSRTTIVGFTIPLYNDDNGLEAV